MSEDVVLFDVDRHVATITLNRPHRRNALSKATFTRLDEIFKEIDRDDDIRAAILTGSDCGTFCAGMDLKEAAEASRKKGAEAKSRSGPMPGGEMHRTQTPMIAAINGHAPAGGLMLLVNCDLRVAVASATLAITEVHRGRGSPWAMPLFWSMPPALVEELTLVGDPLPVQRFHEVGFINYIEPTVEETLAKARALADRIASGAPLSVSAAKLSAMAAMDLASRQAIQESNRLHEIVYQSEDATEGPRAFTEKRPPVWKGR